MRADVLLTPQRKASLESERAPRFVDGPHLDDANPLDRQRDRIPSIWHSRRVSGEVEPRRSLSERLLRAGIVPDTDPVRTWIRLHEVEGRHATVIDLYRLVSEPRGLEPHELPLDERKRLSRAIAPMFWPGFQVTEGSERFDPITLAEYDKEWPARFASWRDLISDSLEGAALRIDHVGSTSVPGLAAKPIVDVQVSVADLTDEQAYVPQLERLGVQLRSRDDLHRFFRPFAERRRDVHVHVCLVNSHGSASICCFATTYV